MINILIWGVGDCSSKVEKIINHKNVNIIAYIDNNKDKQGTWINNRQIINPNNINEFKYEYIFIASQYYKEIYNQLIHLDIDELKIINSYKIIEDIISLEQLKTDKEYLYNKFIKNYYNAKSIGEINSIITGLSYAECGIDLNIFKYKAVNLALSGQDLYYDYEIAKDIVGVTKNRIKNVVIGLSYYSFQYDLSLSKTKSRCVYVYKDILNSTHNYEKSKDSKAELLEYLNTPPNINEELFLGDANFILDKLEVDFRNDINRNLEKNFNNIYFEDKIKEGEQLAILDANKNYPTTVIENKNILSNYLDYLNRENIDVSIVVFPVTKYYSSYFDLRLKKEFYNIIEELEKKYEFTLIDYFDSEKFRDEDFSDCSHLNIYGAKKLTKMLNEKI